jgi:hypothetical protein
MTATRIDIEGWLKRLYEDDGLTHMVVGCDTFDYMNYPRYVKKDEDVQEQVDEIRGRGDAVDEVYSAKHTFEEQMAERRAFNYELCWWWVNRANWRYYAMIGTLIAVAFVVILLGN